MKGVKKIKEKGQIKLANITKFFGYETNKYYNY